VTRIVIAPSPMELGLNRGAYDALVTDLEKLGFQAEIREPLEERFGLPPQEVANVVFTLAEKLGDETLGVLVGIFVQRMRESRTRRRKPPSRPAIAIFYGPDGAPLKQIEIPEAED
jgi:hypothetical protein